MAEDGGKLLEMVVMEKKFGELRETGKVWRKNGELVMVEPEPL